MEDYKKELELLQKNLEGKTKEEVEVQIKSVLGKYGIEYHEAKEKEFDAIKQANDQLQKDLEEANENIVKLDGKLAEAAKKDIKAKGFMGEWADMIEKNKELIVQSGGSSEVRMNLKADMTLGANLTGSAVATYDPNAALNPAQAVNFRNLVPGIQSATGIYVVYREGAVTGAPADQTEGASKANIEFDYTEVTFNAAYLAGYVRFTRQMATDLPFLSTDLPGSLLREYYKAENSKFYTALSAAATAGAAVGSENEVEVLYTAAATLEGIDWMPNGIAISPGDWYTILKTEKSTGAGYGVPGLVVAQNGSITLNGIPVFKASWVGARKYIIGDWTQAPRMTVAGEGLNVRFFEQDANNVTENKVTARVEERNVLVIKRPDAFIFGDFDQI